MNLRKLPDKKEYRTITHKFMSVDGVRMPVPLDMLELLIDLNDSDARFAPLKIQSKVLIEALMECGFIKNGNRGRGGNVIIAGGKYYCTFKFKRYYEQLYAKVESILYPEDEE